MSAWSEQRKKGWRARYRIGSRGQVVTLPELSPSENKARKVARPAEARALEGHPVPGVASKITFADYCAHCWSPAQTKEELSLISYESTYSQHLKPYVGDQQLRNITAPSVQRWIKQQVSAGYASSTITSSSTICAGSWSAGAAHQLCATASSWSTHVPGLTFRRYASDGCRRTRSTRSTSSLPHWTPGGVRFRFMQPISGSAGASSWVWK